MILIVDDDQSVCSILTRFLKKEEYETETVNFGLAGVAAFKEKKPSLVFLDIKLPDISGIEVLRRIKEIERGTPVIMITGNTDADCVLSAFRLGACDCIFKPFDFNYLKGAIKTLIGNRK
ncbi:MAG: hypothetical protein A2231_11180 [Candidatus Firestonebacteria bacterium RIFOXYA2_FULL_40_8]|nr:MAG: hypothetical protein A2231_11180 [Candidatus Firestonebacteria bacterium RIFOXYA2_FULL_40_8]